VPVVPALAAAEPAVPPCAGAPSAGVFASSEHAPTATTAAKDRMGRARSNDMLDRTVAERAVLTSRD
jgi:hypothetical protein